MSCLQLPQSLLGTTCTDRQDEISYRLLLGTSSSSLDSDHSFNLCEDDETSNLQEVTLNFYLEDGTYQRLVVEENLRVLDLCHLLSLKFNVSKSAAWTLVEQLSDLGIERSLEDHEEVLQVYMSWNEGKATNSNKFIFKQDFRKYEFFNSPQQFFPSSMIDLDSQVDCVADSMDAAKAFTLQNMLNSDDKVPIVQSHLWCKETNKHSWRKLFFRVEGSTLYISNSTEPKTCNGHLPDTKQFWSFKDLQQCKIYLQMEDKCSGAPTKYCFCLKQNNSSKKDRTNITRLCTENEKERQCWIIALRLAKYGKKLRENYKEVRARYADCGWSTQKNSGDQMISDYLPMKSRVAMDFTGNYGKIVEDPKEVEAIAAAEGHNWKRRLPCCRTPFVPQQSADKSPSKVFAEFGVHNIQPWFYSGMSRDEATQLLTKYGTVDGVFLVRESRRNPGSYVLSYIHNCRVHHCQIIPVEEKEQLCYSLDNGRTKFYDLLQLVEFYQLNLGCLPTKLTHFLVHRPQQTE
uniref:Growth factor receptor-bound protein 14 n=1 Tax=Hadrurus spadix TaxID=141984 RepID=A0A1W7RAH1_9SCOR